MHRCDTYISDKCLQASIHVVNDKIKANCTLLNTKIEATCGIICSVNKDAYLRVVPDVVWLTPDMIGGEFDIYSNVVWRIDIEPSEDDKDVVSMLFSELMIGNDTLLENGDTPSQILEMLHNGQMIANETLLVDTSVIINKELEISTRMLNKYYLKN